MSMTNISGHVNTLAILKWIVNHDKIDRDNYTIIITGRVGPTGKTWLCNELTKLNYRAVENTQLTMSMMLKDDGHNHVFLDDKIKQVVIVLNEILPMYENKWRKVSNFDPTDVFTFKRQVEAYETLYDMIDIANEYGVVTRADFKDLVNLKSDLLDNKYGWLPDHIRKARVLRTRNGWFIEFPKALPID